MDGELCKQLMVGLVLIVVFSGRNFWHVFRLFGHSGINIGSASIARTRYREVRDFPIESHAVGVKKNLLYLSVPLLEGFPGRVPLSEGFPVWGKEA